MADEIRWERDGRVLIARLNRPDVRNALDTALLGALSDVIDEAISNDEISVLVLGSTDRRVFSAGMDTNESRIPGSRTLEVLLDVQWALETFPKPLVAILDGYVIGGGAELALSADVRIGSPDTSFRFPATGYGLVQGSWHLVDAVGASWAKQIVLTGRLIGADECLRLGLLHEIHDDPESTGLTVARALGERSDAAMQLTKRLILDASGKSLHQRFDDEREANRRLMRDPEVGERMTRRTGSV